MAAGLECLILPQLPCPIRFSWWPLPIKLPLDQGGFIELSLTSHDLCSVQLTQRIDEGFFGLVYKAELNVAGVGKVDAAVKMLKGEFGFCQVCTGAPVVVVWFKRFDLQSYWL